MAFFEQPPQLTDYIIGKMRLTRREGDYDGFLAAKGVPYAIRLLKQIPVGATQRWASEVKAGVQAILNADGCAIEETKLSEAPDGNLSPPHSLGSRMDVCLEQRAERGLSESCCVKACAKPKVVTLGSGVSPYVRIVCVGWSSVRGVTVPLFCSEIYTYKAQRWGG